jgi:hypothetical protein
MFQPFAARDSNLITRLQQGFGAATAERIVDTLRSQGSEIRPVVPPQCAVTNVQRSSVRF